ncbi:TIGR00341 family protein [Flavobacterium sp. CYK-4]|uniref:TIGR00341 family protein n=1 Tax=Flavobacterium lotistagni TaxID=2709660 RepID=UPI00140C032A|nr:TIGR00341 family protein [Flavobacterium lotistagni]NHM07069.1 TIGR00341 family protein [Flavobacterium lotistagni]
MKNVFFDFINLNQGEEKKEKVLENIKSNISFRGSNLWILACAIVIASVGLNVNSTAVIIGAMLISPLMGPIVGAGFALAIFDFDLLKRSAKNLIIATVVSLSVASIYFLVSPFKETQSELLARTAPNIYDVLIAFFGGLVGIIALTRTEKGNPIPGVAIATALMPPLCTAGYGLATSNFSFFFGAFYLYTINCFFICIATFFIVKYLNYKPIKTLNTKIEKRIRYGITVLIIVMIVPSFYLAYNLFQEKKYHQNVEQFIANELTGNGDILIYKQTKFNASPKKIQLAFLAKKFTYAEVKSLNKKLLQYGITNTKLEIKQDSKDLKGEILNELGNQNKIASEKDILISDLQNELKQYKIDDTQTIKEMAILFPELKNVSIGKHFVNSDPKKTKTVTVLLYQTDQPNRKIDSEKINSWLKQQLKTNNIKLVKE